MFQQVAKNIAGFLNFSIFQILANSSSGWLPMWLHHKIDWAGYKILLQAQREQDNI